jgi:8-amino-7-oxononanoate synthase
MIVSISEKLKKRQKLGNLRQLQVRKNLIDFASNDYLGIAHKEQTTDCLREILSSSHPFGSTGSRLLTGNTQYAEELESQIAAFHGQKAALIFNCGYMANVGLLTAITTPQDLVFYDAEIHASIRDGIRLSRAVAFPFRHNDIEHLESRLKRCLSRGNRFICIESVYSTDGSKAPLASIAELANTCDAKLIVDEAHAIGTCGPEGRGLLAENDLTDKAFAQVITFGKALGVQGACVLGSSLLKEALINFAPSFIYTTALPLYALAAIKRSYAFFPMFTKERQHLQGLIQICRQMLPYATQTSIQPFYCSGNREAIQLSKMLCEAGFDVRPLLSPTVQKGRERLRICLHAFNTEEQIKNLLKKLMEI